MDVRNITAALFNDPSREFEVELWDGSALAPSGGSPARGRVVLRSPSVLFALLPPVVETSIADAFISGEIEIVGDAIGVIEQVARWRGPAPHRSLLRAWPSALLHGLRAFGSVGSAVARRGLHSRARDRRAVRQHYDMSNEFYRLFLDPAMVYSCAFFPTGAETLAEAQRAKLELVCRKLDLAPGDRLLDVGCGWGALLTHSARRYGAHAMGVTVSTRQLAAVRGRTGGGRGGQIDVYARDYRALPRLTFDKVASIGMMEHVGREQLARYFREIHARLRPGGLFLNHAIADIESGVRTVPWMSSARGSFIARMIFPDSDLVPIDIVVREAERAGFEVRDLESLREHYVQTLSCWLANLEARFEQAMELVGPRRARAFRLYLASSAAAFNLGRISVYQLLLAKRGPRGEVLGVPRCRAGWYDGLTRGALPEVLPDGTQRAQVLRDARLQFRSSR